jgi:hypothetical protein
LPDVSLVVVAVVAGTSDDQIGDILVPCGFRDAEAFHLNRANIELVAERVPVDRILQYPIGTCDGPEKDARFAVAPVRIEGMV